MEGEDLLGRGVVGDDRREDPALADAAGDQLAVLRSEIDDQDPARRGGREGGVERGVLRGGQGYPIPTCWACWSFLPSLLSAGATITSHFWKLWIES